MFLHFWNGSRRAFGSYNGILTGFETELFSRDAVHRHRTPIPRDCVRAHLRDVRRDALGQVRAVRGGRVVLEGEGPAGAAPMRDGVRCAFNAFQCQKCALPALDCAEFLLAESPMSSELEERRYPARQTGVECA